MSEHDENKIDDDELRPEYDFKGGVRGKYYRAYQRGYTVRIHHPDGTTTVEHYEPEPGTVTLAPDVQEYFPDSEAVNNALRALIAIIPRQNEAPKTR